MTRTEAADFFVGTFLPSHPVTTHVQAMKTAATTLLSAPQTPVFIGQNLIFKSFNHLQTVLKNESSDKLLL
ncbi:hypothetical protein F2S71_12755 [Pseudomonas syringae pv. actinidiae]|nr:hypothetical protein [Pseudomonas syringae pv. actinidiae]